MRPRATLQSMVGYSLRAGQNPFRGRTRSAGRMLPMPGLENTNEKEDLLADWCRENSIIVTNTWFKNHPRRLYTWGCPGDLTKNQIDHVLSSKDPEIPSLIAKLTHKQIVTLITFCW